MKCEFCNWQMSPEGIPPLKRHVEANHPDLEEFAIVWREGQMVVAREKQESDINIHVEIERPKDEDNLEVLQILDPDSGEPAVDSLAENAVNEDVEEVV